MTWNPERMKTAFAECLPQWRQRMQQAGVTSVYSFVSAMALWPVAEAAKNGEWAAAAALGSVLASVGGSVLAGRLQNWKDESDGAQQLAADVQTDDALQKELAVVLDQLDALNQARQALPEAERSWFDQALAGERAIVDSAVHYVATLKGSGAIAQGTEAVAAGRGGVAIGGNVYGNVVNPERKN
ncbi:hypothetical protein [Candidatus Entotheonella palauensis]|uniref:hypothetical protein n=1 Tax=Candidatus Entotheonella palauensis TaxID=93172 RepID=UPI000B7DEFC7|nr:hypothetical protein [Candidatus Entotheonella palauensis]